MPSFSTELQPAHVERLLGVAMLPLALVLGTQLAGCGFTSCDDSVCPRPADVLGSCNSSGCTIDGVRETCTPARCVLRKPPRGSVLSVPLAPLQIDLRATPDLVVLYANGGGTGTGVFPDPMKANADLDGVAGTATRIDGQHEKLVAFRWDPLPTNPQTLSFSFTDGDEPLHLSLFFENAVCGANEESCGL
jgi:hypothetical protein